MVEFEEYSSTQLLQQQHPQPTIFTPISDHACFVTIELLNECFENLQIQLELVEACYNLLKLINPLSSSSQPILSNATPIHNSTTSSSLEFPKSTFSDITEQDCRVLMSIGFGRQFLESIVQNISKMESNDQHTLNLSDKSSSQINFIKQYLNSSDFREYPKDLKGKFGGFPNTGGDIFLHIKSNNMDGAFRCSMQVLNDAKIAPHVKKVQDETFGFLHRKNVKKGLGRDLSGFEDGTENPKELEEKIEAALNEHGDSFLLAQKWVHNLKFFNYLPLRERENDIGRTMDESIELEDKSPNSHVARVSLVEEDGHEIQVIRQSMTFGNSSQHGLFFLSFANSTQTFIHQLESMVGVGKFATPEGHNDHIMRFSTNILGSFYYVPSMRSLEVLTEVMSCVLKHQHSTAARAGHRLSKL
ncbi:hypothetical protein FDP41_007529 [Naegleria fowleri]|uniref:Dyp-type peroxidase C-terminal domain-containing protein n=1 Tax=Naegleria fowleri TaxID=5763 RepID=A0A6A5CBD8_NAEFO|nr:uncharacterized protein FDP41_007529 [Naegleria fowleri]KAF0984352.1 hypothetical protein FDP41_007529 [Naegleria fowleri]CAG4717072.1 unnamed protein product [Naegleria fowleri]